MSDCECLVGCPFFNDKMKDTDGLGAMYKKKYCRGDYSKCARYMVFKILGKPSVPIDLFPNMNERAKKILAAHK
jgi:hypothetical protein